MDNLCQCPPYAYGICGLELRLYQQILGFLKAVQAEIGLAMIYVTQHATEIECLQGRVCAVNQGHIQ